MSTERLSSEKHLAEWAGGSWKTSDLLSFKAGDTVMDLELSSESRRLLYSGVLLRRPEAWFGRDSSWSELFVILFDNYLVITEPQEANGATKYEVYCKPIALDLLLLVEFASAPIERGSGGLSFLTKLSKDTSLSSPVYPLTIHDEGRKGGDVTLFAESAEVRDQWKAQLTKALELRKAEQDAGRVFDIKTIDRNTFSDPPTYYLDEEAYTGKVSCAVPFTDAEGRERIAVGCTTGVWVGFRGESQHPMRKVASVRGVKHCAMLEDFGILVVLADGILYAYDTEALVSDPAPYMSDLQPQKLGGVQARPVQHFSVGQTGGRTHLIHMKKKGLGCVFRVLDPMVKRVEERGEPKGIDTARLVPSRLGEAGWFRVNRDFWVDKECYDFQFLKTRIVICTIKGFEIYDLSEFKSVSIPNPDDAKVKALMEQRGSPRPIGMFRAGPEELFLCYTDFGVYVNRYGDLTRDAQPIEWEGTAERIAFHAPYVLIFDSKFIEVRNIETGRLEQIIRGSTEVRCVFDGRARVADPPEYSERETMSLEASVFGVMEPEAELRAEHLFELVPRVRDLDGGDLKGMK